MACFILALAAAAGLPLLEAAARGWITAQPNGLNGIAPSSVLNTFMSSDASGIHVFTRTRSTSSLLPFPGPPSASKNRLFMPPE